MSNQKGDDSSDGNNSEKMSSDGELPNAEINDSTGNSPENPAIGQSDEEGNSDRICSLDETNIIEIQELTSEDSSQKNDLDAIENVRVSYEFPEDVEEDDLTQFSQKSRKRPHPDKSVHFSKKSKSDESNNEEDSNTENNGSSPASGAPKADYSDQDYTEAAESKSDGNTEKRTSKNLNHPWHISKTTRHHRGEKDTKRPTRIKTDPKTNAFQSINVTASSSEGTLADVEDNADSKSIEKTRVFKSVKVPSSEGGFADVEDNADSQSNPDNQTGDDSQSDDDVSDDNEKHTQEPISTNRESTSSSLLFVPICKEPALQNETKTDKDSNAVSESNTSQPAGEGSKSSATNQLKMRSDVGQSKKRRCLVCNKKLGLTAFKCRCGGLYCPQHRYDKEHGCTFDYKSMGAEEIRKNNPQIVAEKVSKL